MAAEVALDGLSLIKRAASGGTFFWPLQGTLVGSSVSAALHLVFVLSSHSSLCPTPAPLLFGPQAAYLSCFVLLCRWHGVWESTEYLEPASPGFRSYLQDLQAISVQFNILNLGKLLNLSEPSFPQL